MSEALDVIRRAQEYSEGRPQTFVAALAGAALGTVIALEREIAALRETGAPDNQSTVNERRE